MKMKLGIPIAGLVALLALTAMPAAAADPGSAAVQYSIKFVCGLVPPQPAGEESGVKPGNYATAINIHNPTTASVTLDARVTLHYRHGFAVPPAIPPVSRKAYRWRTLEIDCPDVWSIVGLQPGTYVKGMLHLGVARALPIAAVYSSQTTLPGAGPDPGAGISIDVEYIEPFVDQTVMPPL